VLAGLSAGLAAWTKNEGVAFLVVFLIIAVVAELRRDPRAWRRPARLLAGAVPMILTLAWFKHSLAPPSYFVDQTLSQTIQRALDTRRVGFVARALGRELWFTGGSVVGVLPILAAYAAIRGRNPESPPARLWGAMAAVAMAAVYFLAYLSTPLDLNFQISTSVDRLVLQLVPLATWSLLSFAK
jgi:hypothetical protein